MAEVNIPDTSISLCISASPFATQLSRYKVVWTCSIVLQTLTLTSISTIKVVCLSLGSDAPHHAGSAN